MIRAEFQKSDGVLTGFSISGHSGYAPSGEDIVCSAVSSAVQLSVNILDELDCCPDVKVSENLIECRCRGGKVPSVILNSLMSHLESVLEEFPKTIKITISEV